MKQFLLFGLMLSSTLLFSQITFQKTYGGSLFDSGSDIKLTSDGGFIMSGYGESYSSGNDDYYLIKTDALGNQEWAKSIGYSSDADRSDEVIILADGSYVVGGSSWLGVNSVMTSRFDQSGNHLWTSHYEGNTCTGYFRDMVPTLDTGLVVLSETCNLASLIRYDKNGDTLWTSNYLSSSFDPLRVIQNHDGNYMVMGADAGSSPTDGIYLLEINDNGDSLWTQTYHTPLGFYGLGLIQSSDSSYYITGYAQGSVNEIMLLKIDKNGSNLWAKTYTGPNHDYGRSVIEDIDGNIILFSDTYSHSIGNNWDYLLTKVDTAGNLLWSKSYGGNSQEYAWAVEQESDSTYVLMGSSYTYGEGGSDLFFLRTDTEGYSGCNEQDVTPGVANISINEIPSNIAKFYGLNSVAYTGSPIISNISLITGSECATLAAITNYTDMSCFDACDGVGICIVGGGTPPYSITWNDPLLQTGDTATGLCEGTYQVIIIDNATDTIYQTVVISEPLELNITTSLDTTICNEQSIILTAGGASTYTWDNSAGTGANVSVSPNTNTIYTVIGVDANSCADTAQVIVTVLPLPDVTVTVASNLLSANNVNAGVTYQWLDCNDSYAILSGETDSAYAIPNSGDFAVEVYEGGCVDTSVCNNIVFVGITENSFGSEIIVYPNPTNGDFSIDLGENYHDITITLTDLVGKIIRTNTFNKGQLLNLKIEEPAGIYLLNIKSGEQQSKKAIIRMVKK